MEIYYDGQPVGSIYLNGVFTSALMNAHALYLTGLFSMNVHGGVDMDGVEIRSTGDLIGDAMRLDSDILAAAEAKDVVDEKDSSTWSCKQCGASYSESGGFWKCCPEHTPQEPASYVLCRDCAYDLHPDWNH